MTVGHGKIPAALKSKNHLLLTPRRKKAGDKNKKIENLLELRKELVRLNLEYRGYDDDVMIGGIFLTARGRDIIQLRDPPPQSPSSQRSPPPNPSPLRPPLPPQSKSPSQNPTPTPLPKSLLKN
ncbi:hypothetical protein JTB14_001562 [Gonioctena quinquepunctata]|nr:hypothetical protein JTB14_001562 [Gonioctena quinquepunctata]